MVVHAYNPSILAQRQRDPKFETTLGYIVRCLKKTEIIIIIIILSCLSS